MYYYKNEESKRIFLLRNAKDIANKLDEFSKIEKLTITTKDAYDTVAAANIFAELTKIAESAKRLAEAYKIEIDKPLDEKGFAIVNSLIPYEDCIDKR